MCGVWSCDITVPCCHFTLHSKWSFNGHFVLCSHPALCSAWPFVVTVLCAHSVPCSHSALCFTSLSLCLLCPRPSSSFTDFEIHSAHVSSPRLFLQMLNSFSSKDLRVETTLLRLRACYPLALLTLLSLASTKRETEPQIEMV